jgi:hypothetical protein
MGGDDLVRGPRDGETWTVGSFKGLRFLGVARDIREIQFLVFTRPDGGMFVVSKDEFFAADMPRKRE